MQVSISFCFKVAINFSRNFLSFGFWAIIIFLDVFLLLQPPVVYYTKKLYNSLNCSWVRSFMTGAKKHYTIKIPQVAKVGDLGYFDIRSFLNATAGF